MNIRRWLATALVLTVGVGVAFVAAQAPAKSAAKKRVFFVEPKNGATVTSPLHLKFGSEGINIQPVPPGDITTARPGIGHYHIGVEQKCLPNGQVIVKGTPQWVHFGDGKDVFDLQLTPGKHTLALQIGDDLHKTMPGFCQSITVTVK